MRERETECKMEGEFSVRGRERRGRVRGEVGGKGGRMRMRQKTEEKEERGLAEKTTEGRRDEGGRRDEKIAQITTRFHCYPQPVCVGEQIRPSIGQNSTNSSQPIAFIQALSLTAKWLIVFSAKQPPQREEALYLS